MPGSAAAALLHSAGGPGAVADSYQEVAAVSSTAPSTPGRHHPGATSFIRRCWFQSRGCAESSTCSDFRELFHQRAQTAKLPPPSECKHPTYVVTGSRYRHGFMEGGRLETLEFPGEEWHKCCITGAEGSQKKLVCQKVHVVKHGELMQKYEGFCGPHACIGDRDRCLIVDKTVDKKFKTARRGVCPQGCWTGCERTSYRMECVHIGSEPAPGMEGSETPLGEHKEPEKYNVFSLCDPAPTLLALAPRLRRPPRCGSASARRRRCSSFLALPP